MRSERVNLLVTPEEKAAIEAQAAALNLSTSEMVRRAVASSLLFFTLNREDFSFVIHLDRQPRREAQTGSRSGSRSERTLDAVEHSRTLMERWPFLIFHRGGLRIKVINNKALADELSLVGGDGREFGYSPQAVRRAWSVSCR